MLSVSPQSVENLAKFVRILEQVFLFFSQLNTTINRLEGAKEGVVGFLNATNGYLNKTVKQLQEEDLKIKSGLKTKVIEVVSFKYFV